MSFILKECGLTPKKIELLNKINIHNSEELFNYYPFRYESLEIIDYSKWKKGDKIVVEGKLISYPNTYKYGKLKSITRFQIETNEQIFNVVIYNRPWVNQLKLLQNLVIIGKYDGSNKIIATNYNGNGIDSVLGIKPVYALKDGITQKNISDSIKKAYEKVGSKIENIIPIEYINKYKLLNRKDAIKLIHFPQSNEDINKALRTLKYEEFLLFYTSLSLIRNTQVKVDKKIPKIFDYDDIFRLANSLPFKLTKDQYKVTTEILDDLQSEKVMYRLIQGDVGSGKTLVAALALFACKLSRLQSALLAPTEILAKQHYKYLKNLFKNFDLKICVLYSSLHSINKAEIVENIKNGEYDIIIGTHSIIQDSVEFNNLGLVIVDEQHRFGVEQRKKLVNKGDNVDFLLMSATPIPRTLAISIYGDMDISTIESMPEGRKKVKTKLILENSLRSIINEIEEKLQKGEQMYVICSSIEENENYDAKNVIEIHSNLSKYFLGRFNIGLLHGKMDSVDKEKVMYEFSKNNIQILISTTVVEVGVNVENATLIVIYDANRFGLSQLHQLRGRVQRGDKEGTCYLLTDSKNEDSLARLNVLVNTTNGFEISRQDLILRGPGDILGTRQSGVLGFVLGNLFDDTKIINQARIDAKNIVNNKEKYEKFISHILERVKGVD